MLTAINADVELRHVELEVRCQLLDILEVEGLGVGEQRIMELPVLVLVPRATGSFGDLSGMGVDVVQRKILEDNLDFIFIGLTDFGEFRLNSCAERSLIVGKFDNRHWGFVGTTRRRARDRHGDHWRFQ